MAEIELGADQIAETLENSNPLQQAQETPEDQVIKAKLVRDIESKFGEAERARDYDETRWSRAYHNYRGRYLKNVAFKEHEKSRVFVKITKTKVLAAYGQMLEVVFAGNKFPLSIEETKVPEAVPEMAHIPNELDQLAEQPTVPPDVGYEGDGRQLAPGATQTSMNMFNDQDTGQQLAKGPSKVGGYHKHPARDKAARMEKLIFDQIEESSGETHLRNVIFEMALYGTGILKGPFNYNKTVHKWTEDRQYQPEQKKIPMIEFTSVWDSFPDPRARDMSEAEWFIQRHKMTESQLYDLNNKPFFNSAAIAQCIADGPQAVLRDYDTEFLIEDKNHNESLYKSWEVLEYWGIADSEAVSEAGLDASSGPVQINAWICSGRILRIILNPFKPFRLPYLVVPYEKNPYHIFGIGVAENMDDSQSTMNVSARMAIDNLMLAGNLVWEIDESMLDPSDTYEIYPGKKFKREGGQPGQAIFSHKFPNTAPENLQMFDRFRQFADETTGIPSFSHGYTGVTGMTRTASGMSMLMGAASQNIKTVVKNLDDYLLQPLGEAYYHWNMANYQGEQDVFGDLNVRAKGTEALMQKEVRSQRLLTFMQNLANPMVAPFINIPYVMEELATTLELDPDKVLVSKEEALVNAEIMAKMAQATKAPGPDKENKGQGSTGTGGANIGTGQAAMPGEDEFSGNTGE